MLNFIVLTLSDGDRKVYINPNQICSIYATEYHETIVHFSDRYTFHRVKETPEEIKKMIDSISSKEPCEEDEKEVKDAIVARPKCIFCEYATLKVTDPQCDPCFCTANRPNFKPNESCKQLYSKIKEGMNE